MIPPIPTSPLKKIDPRKCEGPISWFKPAFISRTQASGRRKQVALLLAAGDTRQWMMGQMEDDEESNSNLVTGFPATSVLYQ